MTDPNEEPQGDPPAGAGTPPADAADDDDLSAILTGLFTTEDTPPESEKGQEGTPSSPPDSIPSSSSDEPAVPSAPGPGLDFRDPSVQSALKDWYRGQKLAEEQRAADEQRLTEVTEWIQKGEYDKLGEAVADELVEAANRKEVGGEVLGEFLTNTYAKLFADPAMKDLTAEEQEKINPKNFKGGDAEYIAFLGEFIASKKGASATDDEVEKRVQERLKALANERRGSKLSGGGPTTPLPASIPGEGSSGDDDSKSGADLVREGLAEAYEEAAGRRRW